MGTVTKMSKKGKQTEATVSAKEETEQTTIEDTPDEVIGATAEKTPTEEVVSAEIIDEVNKEETPDEVPPETPVKEVENLHVEEMPVETVAAPAPAPAPAAPEKEAPEVIPSETKGDSGKWNCCIS